MRGETHSDTDEGCFLNEDYDIEQGHASEEADDEERGHELEDIYEEEQGPALRETQDEDNGIAQENVYDVAQGMNLHETSEEDNEIALNAAADNSSESTVTNNTYIAHSAADEDFVPRSDDGVEMEPVLFNYDKLIGDIANDPQMRTRLEVYLYALETQQKQQAYKKFRDLSIVDSNCIHKNLEDLAQSVRGTWRKMLGYKVARFQIIESRKIVKVPYIPLINVAGLVCGSPSHLEQMLQFNATYIEPFIDNLDDRIASLEAAVNTRGVDEIGYSPGLLKLLKRTEQFWRPNVDKYRAEDVTILWDCKMHFSDGFSFMGKASQKNQWGEDVTV